MDNGVQIDIELRAFRKLKNYFINLFVLVICLLLVGYIWPSAIYLMNYEVKGQQKSWLNLLGLFSKVWAQLMTVHLWTELCLRFCAIFIGHQVQNIKISFSLGKFYRWYGWGHPCHWNHDIGHLSSHHSHLSLIIPCYNDRMRQVEADVSQARLTLGHNSLGE